MTLATAVKVGYGSAERHAGRTRVWVSRTCEAHTRLSRADPGWLRSDRMICLAMCGSCLRLGRQNGIVSVDYKILFFFHFLPFLLSLVHSAFNQILGFSKSSSHSTVRHHIEPSPTVVNDPKPPRNAPNSPKTLFSTP